MVTSAQGHLRTNDWLYTQLSGGVIELYGTIQTIVVSKGKGRHPQFLRPHHQVSRVRSAVKKGKVAVTMKLGVHG